MERLNTGGVDDSARFVYATRDTQMIGAGGVVPDVEERKLDGHPPLGFDCGRAEQNAFLYERAWLDQQESLSTTYLLFVEGRLAGYATVLMDAISLSRSERGLIPYRQVSALKLGQLGVDLRFQRQGIGQYGVGVATTLAQEVGERVACRYVTLDAQPELVGWYERIGFVMNRLRQAERVEDAIRHHRDPQQIAVSMRFDLRGT